MWKRTALPVSSMNNFFFKATSNNNFISVNLCKRQCTRKKESFLGFFKKTWNVIKKPCNGANEAMTLLGCDHFPNKSNLLFIETVPSLSSTEEENLASEAQ